MDIPDFCPSTIRPLLIPNRDPHSRTAAFVGSADGPLAFIPQIFRPERMTSAGSLRLAGWGGAAPSIEIRTAGWVAFC